MSPVDWDPPELEVTIEGELFDAAGLRIGPVSHLYGLRAGPTIHWAVVPVENDDHVVPLIGAQVQDGIILVRSSRDEILNSPILQGDLTAPFEKELGEYYGIDIGGLGGQSEKLIGGPLQGPPGGGGDPKPDPPDDK